MSGTQLYTDLYAARSRTAAAAVADIRNGETLVVAMAAGQPPSLLAAIADRVRAGDLKGLSVYYKLAMQPMGDTLLSEGVLEKIDAHSFFVAGPDHKIERDQARTHVKQMSLLHWNLSFICCLLCSD